MAKGTLQPAIDWRTLKPGKKYTHAAWHDFLLIRVDENDMVVKPIGVNESFTLPTADFCNKYALKEIDD